MTRLSFPIRLALTLLCVVAGGFLVTTRVDRLLLELAPSNGALFSVTLSNSKVYSQTLVTTRHSISKLNYYLTVASSAPANGVIQVKLMRGQEVIGQSVLPAVFVNSLGASEFVFSPPVATIPGETLSSTIQVAPAMSGLVKMQTRQADGTFKASDTTFTIDGAQQENPLAYQAFYSYRLPFAIQLGGLLVLAGLFILVPPVSDRQKDIWLTVYAFSAITLFLIPNFTLGGWPWLLIISQATALLGITLLLKRFGLSTLSALFGAHIFSFTSWFPLHFLANRQLYILIALLPALLVLSRYRKQTSHYWRVVFVILILATTATTILFGRHVFSSLSISQMANARDIFLDPNQLSSAVKFTLPNEQVPPAWDNFGSYIGIPVAVFALIGLITSGRKHKAVVLGGIICAIFSLTSFIPLPHVIIGVTFTLAILSACGFDNLYRFLGAHDKLVTVLMALVMVIVLFDLWNVSAGTLEFALLT